MDHKFWIRCLVIFIYIFAFDWIFHGMILSAAYQATAHLWRQPEKIDQYAGWMIAGQAGLAVMFCVVFNRGYRGGGIKGGVVWGALLGMLFAPAELIRYAVTPYPFYLTLIWMAGSIAKFALAGLLLAKLYYKK